MTPSRRGLLLWAVALGLTVQVGCTRPPPQVLRVGISAWPAFEFIYLAQEKGFFDDLGLEVRVLEFSSLGDTRRAYERGQVDVLATTLVEVLQIRDASERSPQIVRVLDWSNGADVIVSRTGGKGCATLRGKNVGVELASLGIYFLARGLEKADLSLADAHIVSHDQSAMAEAFRKGELDAVVTYPPTSLELLRQPGAAVVFSSADLPAEIVDLIAIDEDVTRERPDDVAKFLGAVSRAEAWAAQRPDDAFAVMAAREGITPRELAASLREGITMVPAAAQIDWFGPKGRLAPLVERCERILRAAGQLDHASRRMGLINPRFVRVNTR